MDLWLYTYIHKRQHYKTNGLMQLHGEDCDLFNLAIFIYYHYE